MLRIIEGTKLDFDDVLLVPQRSDLNSRNEVVLERKLTFPHSQLEITVIPIVVANLDTTGSFAMAKTMAKYKMMTALHKFYSVDQLVEFFYQNHDLWDYIFYTLGANEKDFNKLEKVREKLFQKDTTNKAIISDFFPHLICLDAANGYSENFIYWLKKLRKTYGGVIMAGNIITPNMTEELILHGADIAKIGIGGGALCRTRIITGVGFPQLSAIAECAFVAHGKPGGQICSDGGCRCPGDVAKAFAGGADLVMIGGLFGGTDECEGEWIYEDEQTGGYKKKALKIHGMSSREAMEKHNGGVASYRAAEGKEVIVPYKGPVENVIQEILGGLRSCCTYLGAKKIKYLPKCAQFVRVNRTHNDIFGK